AGGTVTSDDFETGTRAAAFGGTTMLIDFAAQSRGQSMRSALDRWHKKAEQKAVVDYGFHMTITDLREDYLEEMKSLIREGVSSFKLFMAYPGTLMVDDATIFKALRAAAGAGGLICVHAENGEVIDFLVKEALAQGNISPKYHALTRPTTAEAEATGRAIALAQMAEAPVYIVHVSCAEALARIRESRERRFPALAETCPQYLCLSIDDYNRPGFEGARYVLTPPLREAWNQDELWKALADDQLQVVSTDHCPFMFNGQKTLGRDDFSKIPNGGPGVENRVALIYDRGVRTGRISLNRWIDLVSTTPARLFGLYPKKGAIAPGSDADIVLFDPEAEVTLSAGSHHMHVDYNLYEGWRIKGVSRRVYSRGKLIVNEDRFLGSAGWGHFVPRKPFSG
ncbi:MAG TPA: dihydropyrimidinase, partial [Acidobacteriota bacterium]|nr:dihydropyrimidinase [Acidobacteriota bacterium]